uniref:Uncharacterized protein n=1 Tax=Nucleocytoviricota sp. TaxID=2809609 RepID=A0A9E8JZ07_9VIRU|nr:hypothetical protein [Nucleocytoviricota sp.]UZT29224.1 hypothetical protein [Nucleocytoviricota sp.]
MYNGFALIYSNLSSSKKERLSTILEPLQSMVQLSLLSFSPIGSKLSIYENLLSIQLYKWNQSIIRNYYNDKKDDLYYLFNVINRFNKFYVIKAENETQKKLFFLLNELAYSGLYNLVQTYSSKNDISITNTLNMYKSMIKNPKLCDAYETEKSESELDFKENSENNSDNAREKKNKKTKDSKKHCENDAFSENDNKQNYIVQLESPQILKNIDDLFINIKSLYKDYHYEMIYNFLLMIKNDELNYGFYIEGLSILFTPLNIEIKNWINNNLSC